MSLLIAKVAAILTLLTPLAGAAVQSAERGTACDAKAELLPRLNPLVVQTGRLETGKAKCFALSARRGEFVRAALDIGAGYARTRVFRPRQNKPLLVNWVYAFEGASYPGLPLAFEAPASGWYVVELTGWADGGSPFTMQVHRGGPGEDICGWPPDSPQ